MLITFPQNIAIGCTVYNDANQSIGDAAWTDFAFNQEEEDTDGFHSTVTNTNRITIPTGLDGVYLFLGEVQWASNATGVRGLRFMKGATSAKGLDLRMANNGITTNMSTNARYRMSAGEYMTFQGYQSSGGNLNADYVASYSVFFSAIFLGR